jgi:hypothetical protein
MMSGYPAFCRKCDDVSIDHFWVDGEWVPLCRRHADRLRAADEQRTPPRHLDMRGY